MIGARSSDSVYPRRKRTLLPQGSSATAGTLASKDILLPHMTPDRQYLSPPAAHPTSSWGDRPLGRRLE